MNTTHQQIRTFGRRTPLADQVLDLVAAAGLITIRGVAWRIEITEATGGALLVELSIPIDAIPDVRFFQPIKKRSPAQLARAVQLAADASVDELVEAVAGLAHRMRVVAGS